MPLSFTLGDTPPADHTHIPTLYAAAFPQEDLVPLVMALLADPAVLSLSAHDGLRLIGHVMLTRGRLDNCREAIALLGPLAVAPDRQRQGIGRALIAEGLARLRAEGVSEVLVLGDPRYYCRSGFCPASRVVPPYPLPAEWTEAWQWQRLDGGTEDLGGRLVLPQPWMKPELWS